MKFPTNICHVLGTGLAALLLAAGAFGETLAAPRRVLELTPGANNPRNSEGDMIALKDGSILLVYTHYTAGSGGDNDPAYLGSRLSRDGGLTWSTTTQTVIPNEGGMNVMSVSLLRLKNGDLALFYLRKNSEADCRPVLRVSADEGASWGDPVLCVPDSEVNYYVLNNSRATRLASGRIVLPLSMHAAANGRTVDGYGKLVCYYSDDEGATWRHGQAPFATYDEKGVRVTTQEPGLIELKDGRVMMYARTTHGQQWKFHSSDGCETWTAGSPSNIFGPCGPATIKRLSTGDLVLVWNDHEYHDFHCGGSLARLANSRVPLTVAISKDEGRTWRPRRVLEGKASGWYCYISALEHQGNLLLEYCAENNLQHSRVTVVPLAWLYADVPAPSEIGQPSGTSFNGFFND